MTFPSAIAWGKRIAGTWGWRLDPFPGGDLVQALDVSQRRRAEQAAVFAAELERLGAFRIIKGW